MAILFKDLRYNLQTIIQQIDMGTIGLPEIQRPFVWKDTKVRDLFDSMYKGYPVGYFLFWANAFTDSRKTIGTEEKQKAASLLIVDGQQRLTSLYAVIKGKEIIRENYSKDKIVISFKPLESKFIIPDAATLRSPEYMHNISDIWQENANLFKVTNEFISKLKASREVSDADEEIIQNNIQKLKNLENYPFSALELDAEISEEQVADVFVRINSKGKNLNMADFILTLMSVFWEEGRQNLENFCAQTRTPDKSATAFNYIIEPTPDQMLRVAVGFGFQRARLQHVYSILRGKDLDTGVFSEERRDTQFEILTQAQKATLDIQNWHEFLKAINLAGFIRKDTISSKNNLLYSYVFFLIGREKFNINLHDLKNIIAKWYFMTSITQRYTSSPESAMEMDLARFRSIKDEQQFKTLMNDLIKTSITNDFWETILPLDRLATSSSSSPALYAYYAALNILDAKGLFSNSKVVDLMREGIRSKKAALERHHLFPKAHLERIGYSEQTTRNQIANYALVEWGDNINISDKAPADYLPHYHARFEEEELVKMHYWHALPENWETMKFEDFLLARRRLISKVVKDAFEVLEKRE